MRATLVNSCQQWHRREASRSAKLPLLAPVTGTDSSAAGGDLVDIVAKLPYRQRLVVVGRYWGGWSEAEIAEALCCAPGTVKSLASRALDRIRREVALLSEERQAWNLLPPHDGPLRKVNLLVLGSAAVVAVVVVVSRRAH